MLNHWFINCFSGSCETEETVHVGQTICQELGLCERRKIAPEIVPTSFVFPMNHHAPILNHPHQLNKEKHKMRIFTHGHPNKIFGRNANQCAIEMSNSDSFKITSEDVLVANLNQNSTPTSHPHHLRRSSDSFKITSEDFLVAKVNQISARTSRPHHLRRS